MLAARLRVLLILLAVSVLASATFELAAWFLLVPLFGHPAIVNAAGCAVVGVPVGGWLGRHFHDLTP